MVEVFDEAFGDLREIDIDVRLHGNIDLRAGGMPSQSRLAIEGLPDGIET